MDLNGLVDIALQTKEGSLRVNFLSDGQLFNTSGSGRMCWRGSRIFWVLETVGSEGGIYNGYHHQFHVAEIPPPLVCLDGGSIPVDLIYDIGKRSVGGGSENWGNDGFWEGVHNFSTEVVMVGCGGRTGLWYRSGQGVRV